MLKLFKVLVLLAAVLFISQCSMKPTVVLPEHITNIYIDFIKNETYTYNLEDMFYDNLVQEFLNDGRLMVETNKNTDSTLSVQIVEYKESPITFDELNVPQEYKLSIRVKLRFYDNVKKKLIFEDDQITEWTTYIPPESSYSQEPGVITETEEEAGLRLLDVLTVRILNRTLEGFKY